MMSLEQKEFFDAGRRAERKRIVELLQWRVDDYVLDGEPSGDRVVLLRGVIEDLEADGE